MQRCFVDTNSYHIESNLKIIINTDSVGRRGQRVGRMFGAVCLSVYPQHNSKTNDPKLFKLGIRNDLEMYSKWYTFGLKGQGHKVNKSILHTRTAIQLHSLGGVTSRRRVIALYECLLVLFAV